MRYWPLTAVLLAFWLGRETGAGDERELPDLTGRSLTLATKDGRAWLTARPLESGGVLKVHSTEVNGGVSLRAEESQKFVAVSKDRLTPHVILGIDDDDSPSLLMTRVDGTLCVSIGDHPDGHGCSLMFDSRETPISKAPAKTVWPPQDRPKKNK